MLTCLDLLRIKALSCLGELGFSRRVLCHDEAVTTDPEHDAVFRGDEGRNEPSPTVTLWSDVEWVELEEFLLAHCLMSLLGPRRYGSV